MIMNDLVIVVGDSRPRRALLNKMAYLVEPCFREVIIKDSYEEEFVKDLIEKQYLLNVGKALDSQERILLVFHDLIDLKEKPDIWRLLVFRGVHAISVMLSVPSLKEVNGRILNNSMIFKACDNCA